MHKNQCLALGLSFYAIAAPTVAGAGTLEVTVTAEGGEVLADAVVYAEPKEPPANQPAPAHGVVDQRDKEFIPYVLPVQRGTTVEFPNSDRVRHHVYSFSPAKSFEIPLYAGTPPNPIVFDELGPVSLGCNIHDWMSAFVFVVDTPYFALTKENGTAALANVPTGEYMLKVWHPRMIDWEAHAGQAVTVGAGGQPALRFAIPLRKEWRAFRAPAASVGGYR